MTVVKRWRATRGCGDSSCSRRSSSRSCALVARARVEHRLPRVRLRQLAVGRRRRPPQPALGASCARGRGTSRSTTRCRRRSRVPLRVLGVRRRPARQRGPARPCRRARPRRRPAPPPARTDRARARRSSGPSSRTALFDLFPIALLVVYVAADGEAPALGRDRHRRRRPGRARPPDGRDALRAPRGPDAAHGQTARRLLAMARQGLAVLRVPVAAVAAILFQIVGWTLQLLAVWVVDGGLRSRRAAPGGRARPAADEHRDHLPALAGQRRPAPGGGRVPARAVRRRLRDGFAYGLVLQAIEMSVGVGVGVVMLAREGLSFAALKRMEEEEEEDGRGARPRRGRRVGARGRGASRRCSQRVGPGAERAEPRRDDGVRRGRARCVTGHRGDERLALERGELDVRDGGRRRGSRARRGAARSRRIPRPGPKWRPRIATSPRSTRRTGRRRRPRARRLEPAGKETETASRARRSSTGSGRPRASGRPGGALSPSGRPSVASSAPKARIALEQREHGEHRARVTISAASGPDDSTAPVRARRRARASRAGAPRARRGPGRGRRRGRRAA